MNSPSTCRRWHSVIIPLAKIHTTPSRGRIPSTRESTSIIGRTLPPLASLLVLLQPSELDGSLLLTPELMSGAANEDIFERRLAHRKRLDLSGKRFHHIGDKAVAFWQARSAPGFRARSCPHENELECALPAEPASCAASSSTTSPPISLFNSAGVPSATRLPSFMMASRSQRSASSIRVRRHQHGDVFFIAQHLQILPQIASCAPGRARWLVRRATALPG